ncbi:MAG: autotransporter-associated beta strand repeat-containing protein [Verrucomicrobiota bacterium]
MKSKLSLFRLLPHTTGTSFFSAVSITVCFSGSAFAADVVWNGTTSNDWTVGANWTPNHTPDRNNAEDAVINILTNYPVLTGSPGFGASTPRDIFIGRGVGNDGRVDQNAGSVANAGGNWIFVGVEGATGRLDITGSGSFNDTGRMWVGGSQNAGGGSGILNINTSGIVNTNDLSAGSSGGTGVITIDAGTVNTNGWNFIGKREAAVGGTGTLNINGGTLNNNGDRTVIGQGNSTGSLNITGTGVYNNLKVGDNVFFVVGSDNLANATTPSVSLTGAGIINANRLFSVGGVASEPAGSDPSFTGSGKGILTINGADALLNVTGEMWAGQGAGNNGAINLQAGTIAVSSWVAIGRSGGTGSLTMTGGTINKTGGGNFIIAATGPGTMTQSAGVVNVTSGRTWLGEANNASGTLEISDTAQFNGQELILAVNTGTSGIVNTTGGTMTVGGNNEIQIGARGAGVWNQSAGIVNASGWTVIGRYNETGSSGELNVSGGTFNQVSTGRNLIVGEETTGTLNVSETGAVDAVANNGISIGNGNTGIGTINLDGGTLTAKSIHEGVGGSSTFNFNGGQLIAGPGANSAFMYGLDNVVIKSNGAFINSGANDISISSSLAEDAAGHTLTKTGAGALYLNANNSYTGLTQVNAGTLGGNGLLPGAVSVASTARLNPGAPTGVFGVGSASFAAGGTLAIDIVDSAPASDRVDVAGTLNITNAALTLSKAPSSQRYVIATYDTLVPVNGPFASIPALPSGYTINYAYQGNSIAIQRPLTAFDNFINGVFPGFEDFPGTVGENADPDADGTSNFLEYALGGNPDSGSDRPKIYQIIADSSDAGTAKELLLTIAVLNGTPAFLPVSTGSPTATFGGVKYTIQGSFDLSNFASPCTVVNPVAPAGNPTPPFGYTYRTFSLNGSNDTLDKGFMRVSVTK